MSVTSAKGFKAAGISAGIKSTGSKDLALVVNEGPTFTAAAVFTSNRVKAAPILWSQDVVANGELKAVVLNSGGANACTGAAGMDDTKMTAKRVAQVLDVSTTDVAVCSTGLIGERLPMGNVLAGVDVAAARLEDSAKAGLAAAEAIMTTDSVSKTSTVEGDGFVVGGMAKGAGMLAPALATMLVTITTDADVSADDLNKVLSVATNRTFDRVDSDGCMSTNDTVLLMASGASGVQPDLAEFAIAVERVCQFLAMQLLADAEGASKNIAIHVINAETEADAVEAGKSIARSNLLKCAIHGQDPNWGRVLAAVGTTSVPFDPNKVSVAINDVWVCRDGGIGDDRDKVDMSGRDVLIIVDLATGLGDATVWTNDLTAEYVHENSAYSS